MFTWRLMELAQAFCSTSEPHDFIRILRFDAVFKRIFDMSYQFALYRSTRNTYQQKQLSQLSFHFAEIIS